MTKAYRLEGSYDVIDKQNEFNCKAKMFYIPITTDEKQLTNKRTMASTDVIYGVTMQEQDGVALAFVYIVHF